MCKCVHCQEKIDPEWDNPSEFESIGYDGDFIHKRCKEPYQKKMERVINMSDAEFMNWLGVGHITQNKL